ncbi:MAG: DUF2785 domain-containing protein [Tuberibacillus sp.]
MIYSTFARLILDDHLNTEQLERITAECLKKFFYQIGERDTDSVFTHSFSALVLALVLEKDREKRMLDQEILDKVIEAGLYYLPLEEDIRF